MYPSGTLLLNTGQTPLIVGLALIVWLGILSFFLWKQQTLLKKLFPTEGRDFEDRLAELLAEVKHLKEFRQENLHNLQKVYLKRYNPYQDTGGDQSFTLALLNGLGDGVVITSLHSRAGTRVFTKPVKNGSEDGVKFAGEEEEAVKMAMISNHSLGLKRA